MVLDLPKSFGYHRAYFEVGSRAHLFHLQWWSDGVGVTVRQPSHSKREFPVVKLDPRVQELVERLVTRQELELVHVEIVGGRKPILRVYIDKPGGVTLDDCAAVSERLSVHLDVEDLIPGQYMLEVASPGLDRGLYKPADYERFAGLPAHVKLAEPINGQRNFHGKLLGLEKPGEQPLDWEALLEDETGKQHRLPLAKILKANVEIEP